MYVQGTCVHVPVLYHLCRALWELVAICFVGGLGKLLSIIFIRTLPIRTHTTLVHTSNLFTPEVLAYFLYNNLEKLGLTGHRPTNRVRQRAVATIRLDNNNLWEAIWIIIIFFFFFFFL